MTNNMRFILFLFAVIYGYSEEDHCHLEVVQSILD